MLITGHAMMRSAEPGEAWAYCFVDRLSVDLVEDERSNTVPDE